MNEWMYVGKGFQLEVMMLELTQYELNKLRKDSGERGGEEKHQWRTAGVE